MVRFEKGDRGAGKLIKGTVVVGSFGPKNYIRVKWDDGGEDFGYARHFKRLRKMPRRR